MDEPRKETALLTKRYMQAFELRAYLKSSGIDATIHTGFAVRVPPLEAPRAEQAMRQYDKDWRGDGRYGKDEDIC